MPPEALGPAARLTARGTPLPPFCSNSAVLDATAPFQREGAALGPTNATALHGAVVLGGSFSLLRLRSFRGRACLQVCDL